MIDTEVSRLRRLRNRALQVRAVARAFETRGIWRGEALLNSVACSAWRVARTVSGRLIAHPYLSYQRGPSSLDVVGIRAGAALARFTTLGRARGLKRLALELRQLARDLEDARALTWTSELGDSFARSQAELNAALRVLESDIGCTSTGTAVRAKPAVMGYGAALGEDWPYIAL